MEARIAIREACQQLGYTVPNLLVRLREIGCKYDEIWPSLESGYIETIRELDGGYRVPAPEKDMVPLQSSGEIVGTCLDEDQIKVLSYLHNHKHYGGNMILDDKIIRHVLKDGSRIEEVLDSLISSGYLNEVSDGAYSLNTDKSKVIEKLVRHA